MSTLGQGAWEEVAGAVGRNSPGQRGVPGRKGFQGGKSDDTVGGAGVGGPFRGLGTEFDIAGSHW